LADGVRSASKNGSNKDEYIAEKDEIPSAKKITVSKSAKGPPGHRIGKITYWLRKA
jgi:hypothetical protein